MIPRFGASHPQYNMQVRSMYICVQYILGTHSIINNKLALSYDLSSTTDWWYCTNVDMRKEAEQPHMYSTYVVTHTLVVISRDLVARFYT